MVSPKPKTKQNTTRIEMNDQFHNFKLIDSLVGFFWS